MAIADIQVSPQFKSQTKRAIVAIGLFIITYVVLLVLVIGLTASCISIGILLMVAIPNIWTILIGLGFISTGVLVFVFLIKFLFSSHKTDRSHLFEITQEEEPELFALIDDIVREIGTDFPKKVYLSTDVNASVFYDSNFWSMFFPIKKNLQIGLGLVNVVTKTELKAILAHEFGHFSQKTMKVGSYVYNVNQIIFNLLYNNTSYENAIQKWANFHAVFSFFAILAVKINAVIQWVLRILYGVVNKSYMGLSQQMEFHADEIAANVTGFEPLKNALLRLSLADSALNNVFSFYDLKVTSQQKSKNVYREQSFVMNFLALSSKLPIVHDLPEVTVHEMNKFKRTKLTIEDQWASHPTTEERVSRLEQTNISAKNTENTPANDIFVDIEKAQKKLTNWIFETAESNDQFKAIPFDEFKVDYQQEYAKNSFPDIYNGYYDNKNPDKFKVEEAKNTTASTNASSELFSDEKVSMIYSAIALASDIETLRNIENGALLVKTFDYDGSKYKARQSSSLIEELTLQLYQTNAQIKQHDAAIFNHFWQVEKNQPTEGELTKLYEALFKFDREFDAKYSIYSQLSYELEFVSYSVPFEQIEANFQHIEALERTFKSAIYQLASEAILEEIITDEIRKSFELYQTTQLSYFENNHYLDDNLGILFAALDNYAFLLSRGYFLLKKKLLDYQAQLYSTSSGVMAKKNL